MTDIRSGARLEVNLSFSIKKQIRDAVMSKDYSVDMFDEAQHQIKVLMHDDNLLQVAQDRQLPGRFRSRPWQQRQ